MLSKLYIPCSHIYELIVGSKILFYTTIIPNLPTILLDFLSIRNKGYIICIRSYS
ncbi:hypothetical protein MNV_980002 [Candidatus Methanoperedens nitroreducens]|uniref:Uncharacterized protein n=1 Tax=Candidatus Methanoperedens nitratireducens TaxID=1392998 RepID=A0A284VUD9_9EURY|nr:hypothetical protein MNV_980002 [Candidatus Methanoperedens nitroreducens]